MDGLNKPLDGLRVLDLTRYLAGPYCTMLLGGLGAEVIKIEPPGRGDFYRDRAPYVGPEGISTTRKTPDDVGFGIAHRCRNKKSITLNLRDPEGQALFRRLCEEADVVVENYSPGILEAMGCDYESLKALNPRLILCSLSGFGQNGPLRDWRAYDPVAQGMSGIMSITGYPDKAPVRCGAAIADTVSPLVGVIGILSALIRRGVTGKGDWVDVAMLDVLAFLLPEVIEYFQADMLETPLGNRHPGGVPFNTFAAIDGHVCIAVMTDADWLALLKTMGREDLNEDPRFLHVTERREHRDVVDDLVAGWVGSLLRDDVVAALQRAEIVCGPILGLDEMLDHAQLRARGMLTGLTLPSGKPVPGAVGLGLPIRFADGPVAFDGRAPRLGEHTEEVFAQLAGIDAAELGQLRERGLV